MERSIVIPSMFEREMQKVRDYREKNPNSYNAFNIESVEIIAPDKLSVWRKDYIYKNVVFKFLSSSHGEDKVEGERIQEGLIDLLSEMLKDTLFLRNTETSTR